MAEISAALVKDLREKTGAGMMDCKKALTETGGDIEAAVDWLRAKGLSKAAKKADRAAAEGLVGLALARSSNAVEGALIELNAETDFVARNETFQKAAASFAATALAAKGDLETLLASKTAGAKETIAEQVTQLIATIGENMSLRRTGYLSVKEGAVGAYIHNAAGDGLGRIGVLVALESTGPVAPLEELARKIAMHAAATAPIALSEKEVPAEAVARERMVAEEQVKNEPKQAGKPANVIEKIIEGRIRKFLEEVTLVKQPYVHDTSMTVEAAVKAAEKTVGAPIVLKGFLRYQLGEGVEKPTDDFAGEVAALTGKS
jgi:elongation factor Ts